jgi:Ca-activated chloride channel family protein
VTRNVKSTVKIPSLAVTYVLDRSGSMGSKSQGEEKIDIAKKATMTTTSLLNSLDRIGVLAFDDEANWVVPLTEIGNRRPIADRLRSLGAGGSTDLALALDEAVRVMSAQPAKVKHLIVLSDGLTGIDTDFSDFEEKITEHGITVSTVALGHDANQGLMSRLALMGRGRFYFMDDAHKVSRIFTSETMVLSRDMIVERDTQPILIYPGEMIEGFSATDFPPLRGY